MAVHSKTTEVYANELKLSQYLRSVNVTQAVDTHDVTVFEKDSKNYTVGLFSGGVSCDGWFDQTANGADLFLSNALASSGSTIVSVCLGGSTIGNPCKMVQTNEKKYDVNSPVADIITMSLDFEGKDKVWNGKSIFNYSTATGSVSGTSIDNGAATSNGAIAFVHCTAVSGTNPNCAIKIQHSTDNSTWVDLISFTALTAVGSEMKEVSVTVNKYVRAIKTISGTNPSFTTMVSFARK
jgi:hypothetical protein